MILNTSIGTTNTTILTATSDTAVVSIFFYNSGIANTLLTCYAYPQGSSAGDGTTIFQVSISPKNTFIWSSDEKLLLQSGAVISAMASDVGIAATINYMEM